MKKLFTQKELSKKYPYGDLGVLPQPLPMPIIPSHEMQIDKGIERLVRVLRYNGIRTVQSCEGGNGHINRNPYVQFVGTRGEGLRALGIAVNYDFRVAYLIRKWRVDRGEIDEGPFWEIVLFPG